MSGITEDLERLTAFFGDGHAWTMPRDGRWRGEAFDGSEVVARVKAEIERLREGDEQQERDHARALRIAGERVAEAVKLRDEVGRLARDLATAEREAKAWEFAAHRANRRCEYLEANLAPGPISDEYWRRWPPEGGEMTTCVECGEAIEGESVTAYMDCGTVEVGPAHPGCDDVATTDEPRDLPDPDDMHGACDGFGGEDAY